MKKWSADSFQCSTFLLTNNIMKTEVMKLKEGYEKLSQSYNDMMQKRAFIGPLLDPDNVQAVTDAIKSPAGQGALKYLGGFAGSQAVLSGANRMARNKSNDLLNAGMSLGKVNERANPLTEKPLRTMVGRSGMAPYDAGQEIGTRVTQRSMDPAQEQRFLDKIKGMAGARKTRLESEGEKIPGVLNSLSDMEQKDSGLLQKILTTGSVSKEVNTPVRNVIGDSVLTPAAIFDKRMVARPLMNSLETKPGYQNLVSKVAPEGTKRDNLYGKVRNMID
jgi:hypothetical protein